MAESIIDNSLQEQINDLNSNKMPKARSLFVTGSNRNASINWADYSFFAFVASVTIDNQSHQLVGFCNVGVLQEGRAVHVGSDDMVISVSSSNVLRLSKATISGSDRSANCSFYVFAW